MKPYSTLPTLTLLLAAAAFASFAALAVLGDVHKLVAKAHRLPKDLAQRLKLDQHSRQLPKAVVKQMKTLSRGAEGLHLGRTYEINKANPKLALLTHNRADANNNDTSADHGVSGTIPLEDFFHYSLYANISLGTPPQNFTVMLDHSNDLKVLNTGAHYDDFDRYGDERQGELITGHNEFNSIASSTFQLSDFDYTDQYGNVAGTVASDTLTIGSLQISNVEFGLLDLADWWYRDYHIDGILGLGLPEFLYAIEPDVVVDDDAPIDVPVLNQLADSGQLSQTIITNWYTHKLDGSVFEGENRDAHVNAEMIIGADHSERCLPPNSYPTNYTMSNKYGDFYGWPVFKISSISAGNRSSAVNSRVNVVDYYWPMFVDNATMQLISEAVGATFGNKTYSWCHGKDIKLYTVSDENLANGQNISLTAENGQVVTLQPRDLVIPFNGDNVLYVIDKAILNDCDADYSDAPKSLVLGQNYLNNHCVSTNILTGEVGLGDVVKGSNK